MSKKIINRRTEKNGNAIFKAYTGESLAFYIRTEIENIIKDNAEDKVFILDTTGVFTKAFMGTPADTCSFATDTAGLSTKNTYKCRLINLGHGNAQHINPLDRVLGENVGLLLSEKCEMLADLAETVLGKELNPYELNTIYKCGEKIYKNLRPSDTPVFADFMQSLQEENTPEANKLFMAMELYCLGSYNVFSKTNIDMADDRVIILNLSDVIERAKNFAIRGCLEFIRTYMDPKKELVPSDAKVWTYVPYKNAITKCYPAFLRDAEKKGSNAAVCIMAPEITECLPNLDMLNYVSYIGKFENAVNGPFEKYINPDYYFEITPQQKDFYKMFTREEKDLFVKHVD